MTNYRHIKSANTKQKLMDINLKVTQQFCEGLHKPRLANDVFNDNGNDNIFKSSLYIFNTKRCIPAVVPGKATIYPYERETFCFCQHQ